MYIINFLIVFHFMRSTKLILHDRIAAVHLNFVRRGLFVKWREIPLNELYSM